MKNIISVSLEVLPQGIADKTATYKAVDAAIGVIDSYKTRGINYFVGPSETMIEGAYDTVMQVLKESQQAAVDAGASSVITIVKIFYNPNGSCINKGNYDFSKYPTYNTHNPL